MREILFRGKRIDNGEWVEGYYAYSRETNQHYIFTANLVGSCVFVQEEVDPETICQYTGLTDKNEVKIWENDIVDGIYNKIVTYGKYTYENPPNVYIESFGFYLSCIKDVEYDVELITEAIQQSVIGNKFDNPELIGV